MITYELFLAIVTFYFVMFATPGPNNIMLTTSGIKYGFKRTIPHILGIPSPKQDIDGSEVANVFFKDKDITRIIRYCENDTIAVAQLLLKFNNLPILEKKNILQVSLQLENSEID